MKRVVLAAACCWFGSMPSAATAEDKQPAPPSPERIKELVKALEVPTGPRSKPLEGPPGGRWPTFEYQWHADELKELERAGEAAVPAMLALLEDKTKPGQVRAHAALVLSERLIGTKIKPDPRIIAALNAALKENDPALRWGVLDFCSRCGLAKYQLQWEMLKKAAEEETRANKPYSYLDARDCLRRWLPPEERAFTPAVMDAVLPQVIAALTDEHPEIAARAADVIFNFGQPKQGIKELLTALKRQEPEVRSAVVVALARVGKDDLEALGTVLKLLETQREKEGYSAIVIAVGGFGPSAKDAVPTLIALLKDERWNAQKAEPVYLAALISLGKIGPAAKSAIPAILARFETPKVGFGSMIGFGSRTEVLDVLDVLDPKTGKEARQRQKQCEEEFKKWMEGHSRPGPPIPVTPPMPPIPPR
jgi:HEAT repeat protein